MNDVIRRGGSRELAIEAFEEDEQTPLGLEGRELHLRIARTAASLTILHFTTDDFAVAENVATALLTSAHTRALPAGEVVAEWYLVEDGQAIRLGSQAISVLDSQASRHSPEVPAE